MSKKTGKITKIEQFYLDNNSDLDASNLAKDLNRSVAFVKKHTKKIDTGHVDTVQEKQAMSELFGHKEGRGVTIMTPAASEVADETRQGRINKSARHQNAIHIINPENK
tara:strand:+ start:712 stop:1038 length:327 start_codon:yes stop_codon:yes gene_type:complete